MDHIYVPPELIELHKDTTLVVDIMFVNSLAFFVTMSRDLKFITTQYITSRTTNTIGEGLYSVIQLYRNAGFQVKFVLVDGGFEHIRAKYNEYGVILNTTSANEHVPGIERMIRVIKERARSIRCTLPFKKIPKRMLIKMLLFCVFWLNHMPNKNGISNSLSPRMIMTVSKANFKTHCRIPFGAHVQTHEEPNPTNDIARPRTQGATCLGPIGNQQGEYKFLSINTGKKISRRSFTEVPMPSEIISHIHSIAEKDKQTEGLVFADRNLRSFEPDDVFNDTELPDHNITGVEADLTNNPEVDEAQSQAENAHDFKQDMEQTQNKNAQRLAETLTETIEEIQQETINTDNHETSTDTENTDAENQDRAHESGMPTKIAGVPGPPNPENQEDANTTGVPGGETPEDNEPEEETAATKENPDDEHTDDEESVEEIADDGEIEIGEEEVFHPSNFTPSAQRTYGLRPNRKRHYSYVHHILTQVILTQYSLKKGLDKFKERGEQAVRDELQQLHDKGVFEAVGSEKLTADQKKEALGSLMFPKEKRCGRLKARACANGTKQRELYSREDATSPTVSV